MVESRESEWFSWLKVSKSKPSTGIGIESNNIIPYSERIERIGYEGLESSSCCGCWQIRREYRLHIISIHISDAVLIRSGV